MRESRTVHINADDLAVLRQGHPLLIEGADGHAILRIEWDRPMRRVSVSTPKTNETQGTERASKARKCPYCEVVLRSLKSHVYQKHPGKSLSTTGPKCRYCSKRYPSEIGVMRHEVRVHPKVFRSRVTGKPSAKLQAKATAKETPHV
jgi:hypothetical protein